MAIHPLVMVTEDGRYRVEADATGQRLSVYRDGMLVGVATTMGQVFDILRSQDVDFRTLVEG